MYSTFLPGQEGENYARNNDISKTFYAYSCLP